MNQQKAKISETIDSMRDGLLTLSHQIHDHPEIGFQEKVMKTVIVTRLSAPFWKNTELLLQHQPAIPE